jgi:hypothetical protein
MRLTGFQWLALALLLLSIGWIICGPMLLTQPGEEKFDFTTTGQIGDTIGGITAPVIGLVSAFLVYLSFSAQIEANKIIQEESNFKYILEEHERIKKKLEDYKYKSNPVVDYYGEDGLYRLVDSVGAYLTVRTGPWQEEENFKRAGYLFQTYSIFINEVTNLQMSKHQRKIIQAKIWLYYAEHLLENIQTVSAWQVENIRGENPDLFQKTFEFQYRILSIMFDVSDFRLSLV